MPPASSSKELLDLIEKSALLEPQQLARCRELWETKVGVDSPPDKLAETIVTKGILTQYQVDQLLAGRHRGFRIGKFKIMDILGTGGMGKVYLAEHMIMRRQVALKVLPKAKIQDTSALARFQREARAVAALNHPNIVQAYDIDQEGELHYIVMEFVAGVSVQEFIKIFGTIPWPQAADFVCQTASALQHASESGLIHRDIKPGNLLIDVTGTVKLLDMGLAVFNEDPHEIDGKPLTLAYNENILGTADYLSPEQAVDSHNVDIRADIYSLGGTFYFMLSGSPPFPSGTVAQKLLYHQKVNPKPIHELVPDIPPQVSAVIAKMMAKKPADRFQTPQEIATVLSPYAERMAPPFDLQTLRTFRYQLLTGNKGTKSSGKAIEKPEISSSPRVPQSSAPKTTAAFFPKGENSSSSRPAPESTPAPPPLSTPSAMGVPLSGLNPAGSTITAAPPSGNGLSGIAPPASSSQASGTMPPPATTSQPSAVLRSAVFVSAEAVDVEVAQPPSIIPEPVRNFWNRFLERLPPLLRRRDALIGIGGSAGLLIVMLIALFAGFGSGRSSGGETQFGALRRGQSTIVVGISPGMVPFLDTAVAQTGNNRVILVDNKLTHKSFPIEIGSAGSAEPVTGVSLIGSLPQAIIARTEPRPLFAIENAKEITFRNLVLDGNNSPEPIVRIKGPSTYGIYFSNCLFRNFSGPAIEIVDCPADARLPLVFENVKIDASGPNCIGVLLHSKTGSNAVASGTRPTAYFRNCVVTGPFRSAFEIDSSDHNLEISNCRVFGGTTGCAISGAKVDVLFERNTLCQLEYGVSINLAPQRQIDLIANLFVDVRNPPIVILENLGMDSSKFLIARDNIDCRPDYRALDKAYRPIAPAPKEARVILISREANSPKFLKTAIVQSAGAEID